MSVEVETGYQQAAVRGNQGLATPTHPHTPTLTHPPTLFIYL